MVAIDDILAHLLELRDNSRHGLCPGRHVALAGLHGARHFRAVLIMPRPETGDARLFLRPAEERVELLDDARPLLLQREGLASDGGVRAGENARHEHRLRVRCHLGEEVLGEALLGEGELVHLGAASGPGARQKARVDVNADQVEGRRDARDVDEAGGVATLLQ